MASALSGAPVNRLHYWRRQELLVPEVSAERPILYSFRDLMALRTFVYLRGDRSLQKIRRAIGNLRDIGETAHLSEYKLVAQGRKSIALVHEDSAIDLVEKPGQSMTVVKLGDVIQAFPFGDITVPDLFHPREQIAVDPEVRGGHPVVSGTRIPYELIAGLVHDGVRPADVQDFYPGVTEDAARDAADFANWVDSSARRRLRAA